MKPGRPPKIGEQERKEILENLEVGASLKSSAIAVGVDYTTVYRLRKADPVFARGVRQAVQKGKLKLLRCVSGAETWQSAAWLLERRFGREFGRKDTLKVRGKFDHVHRVRQDAAKVAADPEAMQAIDTYARRMDALDIAGTNGNGNGNGHAKTNGSGRNLN